MTAAGKRKSCTEPVALAAATRHTAARKIVRVVPRAVLDPTESGLVPVPRHGRLVFGKRRLMARPLVDQLLYLGLELSLLFGDTLEFSKNQNPVFN